jgi:integrase
MERNPPARPVPASGVSAGAARLAAHRHLRTPKVKNAKLDSRTARARLPARREPYWHVLEPGCAVGYRRTRGVGTWIARWRGGDGRPRYRRLGTADDAGREKAVGATLGFDAAKDAARRWCRERGGGPAGEAAFTVPAALQLYLGDFLMRGKKSAAETRSVIDAFILPAFGDRAVASLAAEEIRDWHYLLACAPRRLRTRRGGPPRYARMPPLPAEIRAALELLNLADKVVSRPAGPDEALDDADFGETEILDAWRARCATANRILTVLKAALTHAVEAGKAGDDRVWRRVKPFGKVNEPRVRFLDVAERDAFLAATAGAFRRLAAGALTTGCRYGELTRMRARHVDPAAATVFVLESKGGKARVVALSRDGAALFRRLVEGLAPDDRIFLKDSGAPWRKNDQARPMLEACRSAGIDPPASFHVLRHTFASLLWIFGARLEVIAELLGHADIRITRRHYAHIPRKVVAKTVRRSLPALNLANLELRPAAGIRSAAGSASSPAPGMNGRRHDR